MLDMCLRARMHCPDLFNYSSFVIELTACKFISILQLALNWLNDFGIQLSLNYNKTTKNHLLLIYKQQFGRFVRCLVFTDCECFV